MGWNLEAIWDSTENLFFPFHNSFSNYWPLQVLNGISKNSWMPLLLSNGTFQFCVAVLFQASSPEWGIWNYCRILPLTHFLYSWLKKHCKGQWIISKWSLKLFVFSKQTCSSVDYCSRKLQPSDQTPQNLTAYDTLKWSELFLSHCCALVVHPDMIWKRPQGIKHEQEK